MASGKKLIILFPFFFLYRSKDEIMKLVSLNYLTVYLKVEDL